MVISNLKAVPAPGVPETFDEAMKRQGLTEKDLQDGIATYRALALVFLLLAAAAVAYTVYLLVGYGSLLGALLGVAVAALFFSQAFKYDFWALQMRKRTLASLLKTGNVTIWVNKDSPMIYLFSPYKYAVNDLSMTYLFQIFGPMNNVIASNASAITRFQQLLPAMFKSFNTVILAVGALVVVYVTIVGIMNTAHEGQFMGKDWNNLWIPFARC